MFARSFVSGSSTCAAAAASWVRGAIFSSAAHTAPTSSRPSASAPSNASSSARWATASVPGRVDQPGRHQQREQVHASSIAAASSCLVIASSVAVCRGSAKPKQRGGRARQSIAGQRRHPVGRHGRTIDLPHPQPRQIRRPIQRLDQTPPGHPRRGATPLLQLRKPGTVGHPQRRAPPTGNIGSSSSTAAASRACSRSAAASRTVLTSLVSTVTPGSSTRWRRSQPTACSNNAAGPSACVQARPSRNRRNSSPTSASSNARNP